MSSCNKYVESLSNFAFKFKLRCYNKVAYKVTDAAGCAVVDAGLATERTECKVGRCRLTLLNPC